MRRYKRVIIGKGSSHATQGLREGWVGTGWLKNVDLTGKWPSNWKEFNKQFIDVSMKEDGITNRVGAGLACGMTWSLAHLDIGDIVISPDKEGVLHIGEIVGPYHFAKGEELPHRRPVKWSGESFIREDVSEDFQRTLSSGGILTELSPAQGAEIELLLSGRIGEITINDDTVENPLRFALESHLEDFLVQNWEHTELGQQLNIFQQDGEIVGQQFETDTGKIDILAETKDGKELVVIELKRGRVSDVVVGQILRYMGYVRELDETKEVRGIIIGTEDGPALRRALSMVNNVEFYKYEVSFLLAKNPRPQHT